MSPEWKRRLIPPLAASFIRLLRATLRIRHVRTAAIDELNRTGRPYILAFWHGHLLMMVYCRFRHPMIPLISQHMDGELIARTLAKFGVESARGSTTRGGEGALRDMVRRSRAGASLAITPDGPRGPRRVAQSGVITAAQLTRAPIIPIVFTAKKKSFSAPGIASKSPARSLGPSSSTATRWKFRPGSMPPASNSGVRTWNAR